MFPCIIHTEVNAKREDIATIGYDGVRVNRSSFYYHKKNDSIDDCNDCVYIVYTMNDDRVVSWRNGVVIVSDARLVYMNPIEVIKE